MDYIYYKAENYWNTSSRKQKFYLFIATYTFLFLICFLFSFSPYLEEGKTIIIGVLSCFVAFIMILYIVAKTVLFGDPVGGWPSMVCIMLFLGGIQLFCIGILGRYLAGTYIETKHRPIYIIRETERNKSDKVFSCSKK